MGVWDGDRDDWRGVTFKDVCVTLRSLCVCGHVCLLLKNFLVVFYDLFVHLAANGV